MYVNSKKTQNTKHTHTQQKTKQKKRVSVFVCFVAKMAVRLLVKRLSQRATLPVRSSALAAGYDLSSASDTIVPAQGKALIETDLAISVPQGCYGRIAPRSGLALKHHIDVGGGVIDADYRGKIGVLLFNHSSEDFKVKEGDRVAQLILEQIAADAEVIEVDELDDTVRGTSGFGSTGVSQKEEKKEEIDTETKNFITNRIFNILDVVVFIFGVSYILYYAGISNK